MRQSGPGHFHRAVRIAAPLVLSALAALPCAARSVDKANALPPVPQRPMQVTSVGAAGEIPAANEEEALSRDGATEAEDIGGTREPGPPLQDLVVVRLNALLAGEAALPGTARADRAALADFYGAYRGTPLWVGEDGLTERGQAIAREIAEADDWGLDAAAFRLPQARRAASLGTAEQARAEAELAAAALTYARHARGGRVDPRSVARHIDQTPPLRNPREVLEELAAADAPDAYLRGLHPRHPQFHKLRAALLKLRHKGESEADAAAEKRREITIPDGPVLRPGMSHAHVALIRQRLDIAGAPNDPDVFDADVEEAVRVFQARRGLTTDGLVGRGTRGALNGDTPQVTGSPEQRLVLNMERWRWLPEELGDFHVWDNIPEYQTRVLRDGNVIHQAKIIVGKPNTQTPLFSADMKYIVFHPGWGVPNSIKVKEILPYLRPSSSFFGFGTTDTSVLRRHNLRVSVNGRPVDASKIDWSRVDIRRYQFVQPPGPSNVLGEVKFLFPNKHDVYMHDTSQRHLFKQSTRMYSHGCVRVDDPLKFAQLLLAHDKGWSAAKVAGMIDSGPQDNRVTLGNPIPVHITYFTSIADDDGKIRHFADIYGHDKRLALALDGKSLPAEAYASEDSDRAVQRAARQARYKKSQQPQDFFSALFGN